MIKAKQRKIVEKIINFLLNILIFIFGIILLVSIYTSFQARVLNKDYTDFFGYSIFEVQTGSMEPTINTGDWIIVKLTSNVKTNDIVTYRLNKDFITHRIVEVYSDKYVTKGDANNAKDDPITKKQIVGKVYKIFHSFGILRKSIFNPVVLVALISTLFLFNFAFSKESNAKKLKNVVLKIKDFILLTINKIKRIFIKRKEEIVINEVLEDSKDEDLEKTAMYRFVSVEPVDEEEEVLKKEELRIVEETNLENTSMYRFVSVNTSEIDDTLLEVAETEMKEPKKEIKVEVEAAQIEIEEEPKEETLTNVDFELLGVNKGDKKGKNPVDTAMLIKKEELKILFELIVKNYELKNKIKVRDELINTYILAKYYDISDYENNSKNDVNKIKNIISKKCEDLLGTNTTKEYKFLIDVYEKIFIVISKLEEANRVISNLKSKKEYYEKELLELLENLSKDEITDLINRIIENQSKYKNTLEYFLKKLETNLFELSFSEVGHNKNIFALDLKYNINFSKIYSDYIIDKTYSEGVVAEDKMGILLTLLSIQLIKNMIDGDFKTKYILYVPESLYSKEKKLKTILRNMNDEYAKRSVYILLRFKDIPSNVEILKEVKKEGYNFALIIEKDDKLKSKDKAFIYLSSLIFADKKKVNIKEIYNFIPEELKDKIMYEDIEEKVGGFGGEQA